MIVEDSVDIHQLIKEVLQQQNYKVFSAYSGTEALMLLEKEKVDLILLDLMLPGISGEEIVKKVKEIPIIVISAKISPEDKINVLIEGANDYITKPFDTKELLARIQVQLRIGKRKQENKQLQFKNMVLNENTHSISIQNEKLALTKTEYAILKQLLYNAKQVVTKSKLLDLMSQDTPDCDENSLKVHISNIRKKIKKITNEEYIESVWGIGFKMHE